MEKNFDQAFKIPSKKSMEKLSIESILDNSITDFDLYIELNTTLTLYGASPYKWLKGELERLLASGHTTLYYFSADRRKVEAYNTLSKIKPIDKNLPPVKRIKDIQEVGAELTRLLFDYPLTPSSLEKGKEIADAMVECIKEDKTCISAMGRLAHHDYYTYYHGVRVASYSLAITLHISDKNDHSYLRDLALGCFMHDLGKSRVDLGILNKTGPLTEREWTLMRKHPEIGRDLVEKTILSAVPQEIIMHHHERLDGSGYPHGLGDKELMEEVRIAAFSDVFDALTSSRSYQFSRTRYEALDLIKFNMLNHLDKRAFKAMVEILGESSTSLI